jgi:glycosyltransferase involved in cell wall biosynthesis
MSEKKIRVLFFNRDRAGVNYYRTLTPAMEIDNVAPENFHVEVVDNLDFKDPETIEHLKTFDIINYHRQLVPDNNQMLRIKNELKSAGVVLVMDIDDYWLLEKSHPYYRLTMENRLHELVLFNLKTADYITTTSQLMADEIKKVTQKDNVSVLYNSINPEWMGQFSNNWSPDPDGRVRITYMGGSSHSKDIEQLRGVTNVLSSDPELKDKFKIILAGWDTQGTTTEITFNKALGDELRAMGLWDTNMVSAINASMGDINKVKRIPEHLRERYKDEMFKMNKRDITSEESAYWQYEKILTNDHRIIKDGDYTKWLMNFDRSETYPNEGVFGRRWTQKVNRYATVLDETDIVLAPLEDTKFNRMKSNLKQVEAWSRKLPVVCSDMAPYNVDGVHMKNCILIPTKKNAHKYWKKELKKLILDADLRKKIGENLYDDFSEKYNLENVTKKRIEFYNQIIK